MRAVVLILCLAMHCAATLKIYTVKASGGDYPATVQGLSDAMTAAAAWQGTSSTCDDVLILAEPGDYTVSSTLMIPAKSRTHDQTTGLPLPEANICRKYVTLRSTGNLPAEGVRVTAADSAQLVRLVASSATRQEPLIRSAAHNNTGYWRLIGFEFTPVTGATATDNMIGGVIMLGQLTTNCHLADHHIEFDRVYIHGLQDEHGPRRGYYSMCSNFISIINSTLTEFHDVTNDTQGISIYGGVGLKVVNTFVNATGEGFLTGGGGINGQSHPRVLEFLGNDFDKPITDKLTINTTDATGACEWTGAYHYNSSTQQTWQCQAGTWTSISGPGVPTTRKDWMMKNHWEIKAGVAAKVIGNRFANIWAGKGQDITVLINQSNQTVHSAGRWVRADNIHVAFNKADEVFKFATFTVPLGRQEYIRKSNNVTVEHNLVTNIARRDPLNTQNSRYASTARGYLVQFSQEQFDQVARHNTGTMAPGASGSTMIYLYALPQSTPAPYFSPVGTEQSYGPITISDNVWQLGTYGLKIGLDAGDTQGMLNACRGVTNGYGSDHAASRYSLTIKGNVATKEAASVQVVHASPCAAAFRWPLGNTIQSAQTTSPASWQTYLNEDYTAKNGGAAYRTATDGSDAGADIARVNWYTETTVSGARNPYLLGFEVWPTGTALRYNALSTASCTVDVDDSAAFTSPAYSAADAGGVQSRSITFATMGLTPGHYWARVACDGKYKVVELRVL